MAVSNTNITIVQGRLVRDPEARGGGKVASFTVASNRFYYKDGERQEERCFLPCVAFSYEAEAILQNLVKGNEVQVEGRLVTDEWTTDGGDKRSRLVLNVRYLTSSHLRTKRQDSDPGDEQPETDAGLATVGAPISDDDIPF